MSAAELVVVVPAGAGVLLMLLAGIGILRFPDVLIRSSAATKAAGLGLALVLVAVAIGFATPSAAVKLGVAVVLQFVTAPVAGHVIGRAAYRSGAPLWPRTDPDELRAHLDAAGSPDDRTDGASH